MKEIAILDKRIDTKILQMTSFDRQIQIVNVDVSEQNFMRDVEYELEDMKAAKERMAMIKERANLVRHIQQQHSQLLQMSTLLELQRLKTYPTLTQTVGGRYQKTFRKF